MLPRKWSTGGAMLLAFLMGTLSHGLLIPGGPSEALAKAMADAPKLKFEIYQDGSMEYRWRLKSANGEILATAGQGYKAKADCQKSVDHLKADANTPKVTFEVYEDNSKDQRWRCKSAANGQIVASSSSGYKAKADCEHAIDLIKQGAATAAVEDMK